MRRLINLVESTERGEITEGSGGFSDDHHINQLAQKIVKDVFDRVTLDLKNVEKIRTIAREYAEGMTAATAKKLHAEVDIQVQVYIDNFVDGVDAAIGYRHKY